MILISFQTDAGDGCRRVIQRDVRESSLQIADRIIWCYWSNGIGGNEVKVILKREVFYERAAIANLFVASVIQTVPRAYDEPGQNLICKSQSRREIVLLRYAQDFAVGSGKTDAICSQCSDEILRNRIGRPPRN